MTDNLEDALERSEDAAGIDPEIPVASNNVAFGAVKKIMAKVLGWYHQFLVQQIIGLGVAINNVLRTLVEKVTRLETLVGDERIRAELDRLEPDLDDELWGAVVVDAARRITGRVALADAGAGKLLAEVSATGVDAYGVEPRAPNSPTKPGPADSTCATTMSGRISTGSRRRAPRCAPTRLRGTAHAPALLELLESATHALAPGGRIVVTSRTPARLEPGPFRRRSGPHAGASTAREDLGVAAGRTRLRRHRT